MAGWKENSTRRTRLKPRRVDFISGYVVSGGVLACGGALVCVQVRVNPCGACGGADRSHTAVWNRRERESKFAVSWRGFSPFLGEHAA